MKLKEYQLSISSIYEKSIKVDAQICPNIRGQNLTCFIQNYEFAKDLKLAYVSEGDVSINMLISADNLSRVKQKEVIHAI